MIEIDITYFDNIFQIAFTKHTNFSNTRMYFKFIFRFLEAFKELIEV